MSNHVADFDGWPYFQFPYALNVLPQFLNTNWDDPSFLEYRDAFPEEFRLDRTAFETHFRDLVARDVKASYLKALQGYLWKKGYDSGVLKAPSSLMSRFPAQKLFFAHTDAQPSDMSIFISDWFDTVNAGPKTDVASYTSILSRHPDIDPARWLFLSDNLLEVDAARRSGMHSIPVTRPGNAPLPPDHPLSGFAISEFTPESVVNGRAAIAAKETVAE
ncbi:Enolase-phosphatase E1 [Cladobotryum mycophilum]|uniref:Enolase-phosphatase E1 n=1 Tax=Cladobotryum mycophilum TaxID=491253 RepID=A0ABR0T0C0_9HYPO